MGRVRSMGEGWRGVRWRGSEVKRDELRGSDEVERVRVRVTDQQTKLPTS